MNKLFTNKGLTAIFLTLVIATLVLSGCAQSPQQPTQPNQPAKQELTGTITLAGSTSVQPLAEELGQAFMEKNKGVRVEVAGGGSGAGIKAAQTKTADIGTSSRELKADETGIKPTTIAIDGIAVVANTGSTVTELTKDQVKDIFSGKVSNWKEVGGKDAKIVVVNREEGSGTRGAFEEIVLGSGTKFAESAIIQNSTGAVREAVKQDVNAIGYISLGSINADVKALKVNGTECTEENIKAKKYPIARPFLYLVNEATAPTPVTKAFIDFVLSDEGQKVVKENGFITLK